MKIGFNDVVKRALELDKLKRKDLNDIAFKLGVDTRPYYHGIWSTGVYDPERYSNCTKLEVIFTIIERERKWRKKENENRN